MIRNINFDRGQFVAHKYAAIPPVAARRHAAGRAGQLTSLVRKDIEAHLRQMERRIENLEAEAWDLMPQDPELVRTVKHLTNLRFSGGDRYA